MAKPIPKKRPKISTKPIARGKRKPKLSQHTMWVGVDISLSSVALAGMCYDHTMQITRGPQFHSTRWEVNTHYFDRISQCARAENFMHDLTAELKFFGELPNVFIAVEEPWPLGMVGRTQSNALKQQAEISGAFLGGLLRYGYRNIFQIAANSWRKVVADDLGITIHHSKWKDPSLCEKYNCKPADVGKFRAKQWALECFSTGDVKVPDWPDIVNTARGRMPRPEGSRAKAFQCDDRYDALAVLQWMRDEWQRGLDK